MEAKLYPGDFGNIIRCVSLLRDHCNDASIKAGILRQSTNDRASVFEFDLAPLIGNCDFVLSGFKAELPLLKALSNKEVTIITTEKAVTFSSQRSAITFDAPKPAYVDNPFMAAEELSEKFSQQEENLILEYPIKEDVSNLVKVVSAQFNTPTIEISFEGETASILSTAGGKTRHARIDHEIPLKRPFKGSTGIVVMPFEIDHDGDIVLRIYISSEEDMLHCKFSTSVEKINVNVYTRSRFTQTQEK